MNLIKDLEIRDKIIKTDEGDFKIRKNGRVMLCLSYNTKREEYIKATPIN